MTSGADSAPSELIGALCWLNWKRYDAGLEAPADASFNAMEATLFSDAVFTGGLSIGGMGPYALTNLISSRDGEAGEALVLHFSWHLPERQYNSPIPEKARNDSWLGLALEEEMAALLSLFLGVRVWSAGITREFKTGGDPAGLPVAYDIVRPIWQRSKRPVLPTRDRLHLQLQGLPERFAKLPTLSETESVALIRAARQYQLALWVADDDPELAWLQLVSAIEVAATQWRGQFDPKDALAEVYPKLIPTLTNSGGDELVAKVANQLKSLIGSTRRFLDFMDTFDTDPPEKRCEEYSQVPWHELRNRLKVVYRYRSGRLHSGEPFPSIMNEAPMVLADSGLPCEKPIGLAFSTGTAEWPASAIPMHLWLFEYLVRHALGRWFQESLGASS